jgi:hypothetical protein
VERIKEGRIVTDDRQDFKFLTKDGQLVGTKAASEEEARLYIESCLQVELKKVA